MIYRSHIDDLAFALSIDQQLRDGFLANPLEAVAQHNQGYVRRYREQPIELNEEERQLIVSLPASSIQQFYEVLDNALQTQLKPARYAISIRTAKSSTLKANESAA